MNVTFKAGEYTQKTEKIINEICDIFDKNGKTEQAEKLKNYKKQIDEKEKIRIAFVGQYSSGKSSIISALTGDSHIQIGSDVTTLKSGDYEWGDFLLTDTPGLHNNDTHDEIAAEAIKTADLIVYCITSELFTPNTLADFKNLAFEKNYLSKMILVINKLGMEACEDREKLIANYVKTLDESLSPHSLDEIKHCFTDVLEYKKGMEKNKPARVEKSRFENFIGLLNDFLEEKGLVCKLLTPVHTAEGILDETFIGEAETQFEEAERTVLSRAARAIKQLRAKADSDWNGIIIRNTLAFSADAFDFFDRAKTERINCEAEFENILNNTYNNISNELCECIEAAQISLDDELEEIGESKQAQYYLNEIKKAEGLDLEGGDVKKKSPGLFKGIFDSTKGAVKDGTKNVSQESIKNTVKNIAKKINYKFKPWEATKIAEKIGKVLEFLGPTLDVIDIGIGIYETVSESNQAKKEIKARAMQRKQVEEISRQIKVAYEEQKSEFMEEVFNSKLKTIQQHENEILQRKSNINNFNRKMSEFKMRLEELNKEILSET